MTLLMALAGCEDDCTATKEECCKNCEEGKACGDSCIPSNQTCHTSGGCACDVGVGGQGC